VFLKRFILFIIFIILISAYGIAENNDNIVVSLGNDLTENQKQQMIELFNVGEDTKILEVTNEEERRYLGKYINDNLIGTKAISCAYVEKLKDDSGIYVETYNITWVTKEMYMNALVTAGVHDAKVKVAAPVNVSGTAALTGIIKAFEDASGKNIGEREKEIANEEIATTGKLGQEIGKNKASYLIKEVKEEVISKNIKNEKEIREIVINVAKELEIDLNNNQINEIVSLMKEISKLNLNLGEIKEQLKGISDKLNEVSKNTQETVSLLQRILNAIRELLDNIFTLLKNIF
jgi:uncharacterized protein YpuA (DUF1002 family)